jgi:superfamily II DNA or RNA helicase
MGSRPEEDRPSLASGYEPREWHVVTTIEALTLPTYAMPGFSIPLLAHQVELNQRWDSLESFLLTASTGCGKTLAAFLPALCRGESVIAAYPTNALLQDQAESLVRLANVAGKEARILRPEENVLRSNPADIEIIPIDGPGLEASRQALRLKRKGEALDALLTVSSRPTIILTNPDVLYLMAAMCYRDSHSALTRLASYSTLILDEFHLYTGIELARFLYLIHLLRFFGGQVARGIRRVGLLSATPLREAVSLLHEVLPGLAEVTPEIPIAATHAGAHIAIYPLRFSIDLAPPAISGRDDEDDSGLINSVVRFLRTRRDSLRAARLISDDRTVPALVFLNSVVAARRLEQALLADGWLDSELGSVRGLMNQEERAWGGKTVVVATAAAEVGIDFDCRLLILEAGDLGSFAQRLGRAGRHADAEAYLVGIPGAPGIPGLRNELPRRPAQLSRKAFIELAASVFPSTDIRADFVTSKEGVFVAASLTEHLLQRVAADYGADSSIRERVRRTLLEMERAYFLEWQARRTDHPTNVSDVRSQVRRDMERAVQGRSAAHGWMKVYLDNFPSFRSQTLQVTVSDQEEARRRREPTYRADLRTLARWARLGINHRFEAGRGYVVDIAGYADKPHRYCVVLHQPPGWPTSSNWPPDGLFWIGREEDTQQKVIRATLISDSTGGCFPGYFPPTEDPVLAFVVTQEQLAALDFDWRLQTWPLRGQAGNANDAQSKVILLGDSCLMAQSRLLKLAGRV